MKARILTILFFHLTISTMNCNAQEATILRSLPADCIQVRASSEFPGFEAQKIVMDGSFERDRLVKNNTGSNMWISQISETTKATSQSREGIAWLTFTFNKAYPINAIQIWNHNQNDHTRRGLKKVYIQYTTDGATWIDLKDGNNDYFILPESGGHFYQEADIRLQLAGIPIKGISITADTQYGNHYHADSPDILREASLRNQNVNFYSLGKIKFYVKEKTKTTNFAQIDTFKFTPSQGYLRTDNGPSREFILDFPEPLFLGANLTIKKGTEIVNISIPKDSIGIYSYQSSFMPGFMEYDESVSLKLTSRQGVVDTTILVPAARKWELHFLAHSHQDIGYTHRQREVMLRQWDNLEKAIDLSNKTRNYPEGSRYKWNTEATWSLYGYIKEHAGTQKAEDVKAAIKAGRIGVDATLGSILTGISKQEELMHLFDDAQLIEKELGMQFSTAMFSDLPGAVWGMAAAMSQNGIRYFSSAPNYSPNYPSGGSRVGHMHRIWGDKPFYWTSPSGNDKVLHWAAGTGYSLFHSWIYDKLSVCGLEPIWQILEDMQRNDYPYPLTYMRYTIHGDNGPPDYDMPNTIKAWNERYEYPKFHISTMQDVFCEFEERYGDVIPTYSGDLSPYWDDGAASTAKELSINRNASEKLNQAEVVWSMFDKQNFPAQTFRDAWKYSILFSEHTWGSVNSYSEPNSDFTRDQWREKQSYALSADSLANILLHDALPKENMPKANYIQVLNTNSWQRTDIAYFQSSEDLSGYALKDEAGNTLPIQKMRDGSWGFVANVPALGSSVYQIVKNSKTSFPAITVSEDSISNGLVTIKINATNGTISTLQLGDDVYNYASLTGLNNFVSTERNGQNPIWVDNAKLSIVESGAVKATIRIESHVKGCELLVREVALIRGLDKVEINNTIDKSESLGFENLRFYFPFHLPNSETNIDLAWSSMFPERQQLRGANKNFYNVLNQVGVMNTKRGVVFTTPDAPFVELGSMTAESWMTETMWRTDWQLTSVPAQSTIYSWTMNNSWTTNYKRSQAGKATFRYSISAFDPNNLAESKRKGVEASQPLIVYKSVNNKSLPSLLNIKGSNKVAVSTIKPVADGYFIRFFNQDDASTHFDVEWGTIQPRQLFVCNAKGEIIREVAPSDYWLKPYEIVNIIAKP